MKVVCPRCGKEGVLEAYLPRSKEKAIESYIQKRTERIRFYYRVVHYYYDENGKRRKRRCYVGPTLDYRYVAGIHGVKIYNIQYETPSFFVMDIVGSYISKARKALERGASGEELKRLRDQGEALIAVLYVYAEKVRKVLSELPSEETST